MDIDRDKDNKRQLYTAGHKITIPSHTYEQTSNKNICKFVDREGNWTHYWIKSKKMFVPAVNHIIRLGYPKGERFYQYLLSVTPEVSEKRLRTAGEEGARTHDAIRHLIEGKRITLESLYYNDISKNLEPLTPEEWYNLEAFQSWCAKYQPHVLIVEYTVWSDVYKFAGTIDFLGTIHVPEGDKTFPKEIQGRRIPILIDWKTSSGIWDEYELQTAAYRKAFLEKSVKQLDSTMKNGLWTGIVRLGTAHKIGYEMRVWNEEESERNFGLFTSAYNLYIRKAGDVFEPELKQIPIELEIRVPQIQFTRSLPPQEVKKRTKMAKKKKKK